MLDERENMDLSAAIFGGALAQEPFYRAPSYALVLAGLRCLGVPAGGLFPAALLLGTALHAVDTALVACAARRWFGNRAALAGGLLFAFDPVMVHYATQALDSTLSLALFLLGLNFFAAAVAAPDRAGRWAGAGISWAAAALVRPSYLVSWALAPAFALLQGGGWRGRMRVAVAALAGALLFAAASAWQWRAGGTAGFLPWQGAYNLWAANRPGANGRYYTQRISLPAGLARANPARAESIILYQLETGDRTADIPAMNRHWRARFLGEVSSHPLEWAALMARKAYALLNNWEQYNNKTFAFHKARSPWLSWNPICWGIVFMLGVAGAARLCAESPRAALALAAVWCACAAGILLFSRALVFACRWPRSSPRSPEAHSARPASGGAGRGRRSRRLRVPSRSRVSSHSPISGGSRTARRSSRTMRCSPGRRSRSATTRPRSARRGRP